MSTHDDIERWSPLRVFLFTLLNRTPRSNLAAVDRLSLGPRDRFLDLGCGAGAALEYAAATGAELAGVDPSPPMAERAARRVAQATVEVGSAEAIPFPDDRFTAVLTVSAYHHWADPGAGLAEILRVLAPGGRLLIFERKLKRSTGHGIHPDGADRLAASLLVHGYAHSDVSELRVRRSTYLAVSARAPVCESET